MMLGMIEIVVRPLIIGGYYRPGIVVVFNKHEDITGRYGGGGLLVVRSYEIEGNGSFESLGAGYEMWEPEEKIYATGVGAGRRNRECILRTRA